MKVLKILLRCFLIVVVLYYIKQETGIITAVSMGMFYFLFEIQTLKDDKIVEVLSIIMMYLTKKEQEG